MQGQTHTVRRTRKKITLFSGDYLRNRSTLDIGVLGYIGTVQHKEHSPEVLSIPPVTPCISLLVNYGWVLEHVVAWSAT